MVKDQTKPQTVVSLPCCRLQPQVRACFASMRRSQDSQDYQCSVLTYWTNLKPYLTHTNTKSDPFLGSFRQGESNSIPDFKTNLLIKCVTRKFLITFVMFDKLNSINLEC